MSAFIITRIHVGDYDTWRPMFDQDRPLASGLELAAPPLDVEGATARIHALLADHETFGWAEAVGPSATLVDVLSTFIALLELAKRSALTLSQTEPFGPMVISRGTPREAA